MPSLYDRFAIALLLLVAVHVSRREAIALDYDPTGVWFCGSRDANFEHLINIDSVCRDAMSAYVPSTLFGYMTTRTPEQACLFVGGGRVCYESEASRCQLPFDPFLPNDYFRGVQCSPYIPCVDKDQDGFPCCPNKNCVGASAGWKDAGVCEKQDCAWPGVPELAGCSDENRGIYPGSAPLNSQVRSVVARLDETFANGYNALYGTELEMPTVLTPIEFTAHLSFCGNPVPSFNGQISLYIREKDQAIEVSRVEAEFRLMPPFSHRTATYVAANIDPTAHPLGQAMTVPKLQLLLVDRIRKDELIYFELTLPELNTTTGKVEYPENDESSETWSVIRYANCQPIMGRGSSHFVVRYHESLTRTQFEPYKGENWDEPADYVANARAIATSFFNSSPHFLLKKKIQWNVDLSLSTVYLPNLETPWNIDYSDSLADTLAADMGYSGCNQEYIIFLHNLAKVHPGFAIPERAVLLNPFGELNLAQGDPKVLLHEIGHMYSNLKDEYLLADRHASALPREFIENAPKDEYDSASLLEKAWLIELALPNCLLPPAEGFDFLGKSYGGKTFQGCQYEAFLRPSETGLMHDHWNEGRHNIIGCAHTMAQAFGKSASTYYQQCSEMPGINVDIGAGNAE